MLRLWLVVGVGVAVLIVSGMIASMANSQPRVDPVAVVTAYETARNTQDIETALSYFADNAIITQRNTTFAGKDEIRKYLGMTTLRARTVVMSDAHATGNIVTWSERSSNGLNFSGRPQGYTITSSSVTTSVGGGQASGAGQNSSPTQVVVPGRGTPANGSVISQPAPFVVTVEAVVQGGKIQSLEYVFGGPVPRTDTALDGRELPAGIGLAAVLALLAGVLLIASTGFGRTAPVASSLRGRLLQDLQGWAAARQ